MKRVALITGGQRGIGFGIAKALVGAGYSVALASRSALSSRPVQAAMALLGPAASYFQYDQRIVEEIPTLFDAIEDMMGSVTTLVANAGVPSRVRGDMLNLCPGDFDDVLGTNLRGTYFLAQEASRRMLALKDSSGYRSLSFVTSVSAELVSEERADYCISKAAAAMVAKLFAVRLAPHGIGVFELRPGIIETDMTAGKRHEYSARIEAGLVPAARWGQPDDVGSIIVPLADGQWSFATGAVIPVDGGLSIARL